MTQGKQENRLSRWSRRKQQTAEETKKEDLGFETKQQDLAENEIQQAPTEDQQQVASPEPVLSDADMEPIECLTDNSDFSRFMSPGVSDELRNLALGKMFQTPFFNIRDGLDEYDEDYTSFEKLGDIITSDMRHQMEVEASRKLESEAKALAESGPVTGEDELERVEAETPAIAAEEKSQDDGGAEPGIDDVNQNTGKLPHQSVDKMQRNNE